MPASVPANVVEKLTDSELNLHALTILRDKLGLDDFLRFLQMNPGLSKDYTAERHLWLDGVSIDDFLDSADSRATSH